MPKIPVYEQQLNAPRGAALDVSSTATYLPFANQVSNTGAMLEQSANKLIAQQDNILATVAYTEYLDAARAKRAELLKKEGTEGFSLQSEYNDWHAKKKDEIIKNNLGVFAQKEIFNKYSEHAKESNLDVLASAESRNMKVARDESIATLASETKKEIRFHAGNDLKSDDLINTFRGRLAQDFPGHDIGAINDKVTEEFLKARVQSLAETNPQKGMEVLEANRIALGDSYDKLKEGLTKDVDRKITNDVYVALDAKFPGNPDAKIKYISSTANREALGIDLKQMQYLKNIYHGESVVQEANSEKYKLAKKNETINNISAFLRKSDVKGALDEISKSKFLDEGEKLKLETSISQGQKTPYEITDDTVYGKLSNEINTNPDSIENSSDIWAFHGKGLSTASAEKLTTMWDSKRTKETTNEKRMKEILPARYSSMLKIHKTHNFFDGDDIKNDLIYGSLAQQLDNFFISKKDATDEEASKFFDNLTKPYQGNWVTRMAESFKNFFTGTDSAVEALKTEPINTDKRNLAIQFLKKNGKIVNEETIKYVMDGLEKNPGIVQPDSSPVNNEPKWTGKKALPAGKK